MSYRRRPRKRRRHLPPSSPTSRPGESIEPKRPDEAALLASLPPHPNPLPNGERECAERSAVSAISPETPPAPPLPDGERSRAERAGEGASEASSGIIIWPAAGEADAAAIHRFLCVTGAPVLLAPIDPVKSMAEVLRVVQEEAAFVAERAGELVGTIGIVYADWWYARAGFLTDRWCFVAPSLRHRGVFAGLIAEADALAAAAGVPFVLNGKARRKIAENVIATSPRMAAT